MVLEITHSKFFFYVSFICEKKTTKPSLSMCADPGLKLLVRSPPKCSGNLARPILGWGGAAQKGFYNFCSKNWGETEKNCGNSIRFGLIRYDLMRFDSIRFDALSFLIFFLILKSHDALKSRGLPRVSS